MQRIFSSVRILSLFVAAIRVSSLSLVLQFDGSLRPPGDPIHGFTYASNVLVNDSANKQLDGCEKLASCSATISLHSPLDNGRKEKLIAVGGRYLPNAPGITSADTEYDGFLLGLEWLVNKFSSKQEIESGNSMLNEWNDTVSKDHQILGPNLIIRVRGDCKAVIDQMKSRSVPRKMEAKYDLAMERIQSIKDLYAEHQKKVVRADVDSVDASAPLELSFHFEHVPRERNSVCDALCKLVINQKQAEIVEGIHDLIRSGDAAGPNRNADGPMKGRHAKTSKKKRISCTDNDFFQQAMTDILDNPQLCHSSRLALACELIEASLRQEDAVVLGKVSAFLLKMTRRWSRIYYFEDGCGSVCKDSLRKVSVGCERLSRHFSGRDVLEPPLYAENVDLCHAGIMTVFEICTSNECRSQDKDNSKREGILRAYMDIAETICGTEAESPRKALLQWNMIQSKDMARPQV